MRHDLRGLNAAPMQRLQLAAAFAADVLRSAGVLTDLVWLRMCPAVLTQLPVSTVSTAAAAPAVATRDFSE